MSSIRAALKVVAYSLAIASEEEGGTATLMWVE
jgi:hypothetical protein